jgi:hypothetical protein
MTAASGPRVDRSIARVDTAAWTPARAARVASSRSRSSLTKEPSTIEV